MLLLAVLLVIGITVTSGCAGSETATPNKTPTQITENVTPQETFTLIQDNQNNPDFVIISNIYMIALQ